MRYLRKYVLVWVLSFLGLTVAGQTSQDGWKEAISQYYAIVLRCVELRDRVNAGEDVAPEAMEALIREVETLRERLQVFSGSLSARQQQQFQAIRQIYATGHLPKVENRLVAKSFPVLLDVPSPSLATSLPVAAHAVSPDRPWSIGGLFMPDLLPDLGPGLMLSARIGDWGFYLKGSHNFRRVSPAYSCLSDGTGEDVFFWGTGASAITRFQVSGGMARWLFPGVGIYVGTGYGKRWVYWEDYEGEWAQVRDLSRAGLVLEGGILFRTGRLLLAVGGTTIGLGAPGLQLGIGWDFLRKGF